MGLDSRPHVSEPGAVAISIGAVAKKWCAQRINLSVAVHCEESIGRKGTKRQTRRGKNSRIANTNTPKRNASVSLSVVNEKAREISLAGFLLIIPAASYSPTQLPAQYHRLQEA